MFLGLLDAKPCRTIIKLPQKVSLGTEAAVIIPRINYITAIITLTALIVLLNIIATLELLQLLQLCSTCTSLKRLGSHVRGVERHLNALVCLYSDTPQRNHK